MLINYLMRKYIIAGNWKMHGSREANAALLAGFVPQLAPQPQAEVVVLPPLVYLQQIQELLASTPVKWGAQNISANEPGAYTGEVAATMLQDFDCTYILVGHSERRHIYGEDNQLVALKFAQAQHYGFTPILCVGETLAEREAGNTMAVVSAQIDAVLNLEGGAAVFAKAVIAYEPVWAIGTGVTATPEQAQEIHATIRQQLQTHDVAIAEQVRILYGGSVKANNAAQILQQVDIDGALIGGAALDSQQFLEIIQCIK